MFDYIIVGQGIAGTVLAHTFLKNNKNILIVDQETNDSPSSVAAGIYNPITGKRMVKTWMANTLFPFMEQFYSSLERELGEQFLFKMPVYKPFSSFAEQNYLISENERGHDLLKISPDSALYKEYIFNDFGGFETLSSGYVDVKKFLRVSRELFQNKGCLFSESLQYHDLVVNDNHVVWKNISAKKILFCDGPRNVENPFFSWLPFVLTKGEILEIDLPTFPENIIFNKGVFLLPVGGSKYKVGSTYEWQFSNNEITAEGKAVLVSKLKELTPCPFAVSGQQSGIRPTVKDRRPLIGFHPQFKPLGIFNGLGTKGISLAPYFAQHFYECLEEEKVLAAEVNIRRFYSLL